MERHAARRFGEHNSHAKLASVLSEDEETAGLCASCRHVRRVESGRGSVFWLCRRAQDDPDYARYPPIPVRQCAGWEVSEG